MAYSLASPLSNRYFVEVSDSELSMEMAKAGHTGCRSVNREAMLTTLSTTTNSIYYLSSAARGGVPGASAIHTSIPKTVDVSKGRVYRELTDDEIFRALKTPVTGTTRPLLVKKYIRCNPRSKVLPESQLSLQPFVPRTAYDGDDVPVAPCDLPSSTGSMVSGNGPVPVSHVIRNASTPASRSSPGLGGPSSSASILSSSPRPVSPLSPGASSFSSRVSPANVATPREPRGISSRMDGEVCKRLQTPAGDSIAKQSEVASVAGTWRSNASCDMPTTGEYHGSNPSIEKFTKLSLNGSHPSSDVAFVFPQGEVLYASRGYLSAACTALEPVLFATELFPVSIISMTGIRHTVQISKADSVRLLKWKVHLSCGVPVDQQRLVYASNEIYDSDTIEGSGLAPNTNVNLVLMVPPTSGLRTVKLTAANPHVGTSLLKLEPFGPEQNVVSPKLCVNSAGRNPSQPEVSLPLNIQHVVVCDGISVSAFETIIGWHYQGYYGIGTDDAAEVAILAEMLQMDDLCEQALGIMRRTLTKHSLLYPLVLSFRNHSLRLQSVCLQFLKDFSFEEDLVPFILPQLQEDTELAALLEEAIRLV